MLRREHAQARRSSSRQAPLRCVLGFASVVVATGTGITIGLSTAAGCSKKPHEDSGWETTSPAKLRPAPRGRVPRGLWPRCVGKQLARAIGRQGELIVSYVSEFPTHDASRALVSAMHASTTRYEMLMHVARAYIIVGDVGKAGEVAGVAVRMALRSAGVGSHMTLRYGARLCAETGNSACVDAIGDSDYDGAKAAGYARAGKHTEALQLVNKPGVDTADAIEALATLGDEHAAVERQRRAHVVNGLPRAWVHAAQRVAKGKSERYLRYAKQAALDMEQRYRVGWLIAVAEAYVRAGLVAKARDTLAVARAQQATSSEGLAGPSLVSSIARTYSALGDHKTALGIAEEVRGQGLSLAGAYPLAVLDIEARQGRFHAAESQLRDNSLATRESAIARLYLLYATSGETDDTFESNFSGYLAYHCAKLAQGSHR